MAIEWLRQRNQYKAAAGLVDFAFENPEQRTPDQIANAFGVVSRLAEIDTDYLEIEDLFNAVVDHLVDHVDSDPNLTQKLADVINGLLLCTPEGLTASENGKLEEYSKTFLAEIAIRSLAPQQRDRYLPPKK